MPSREEDELRERFKKHAERFRSDPKTRDAAEEAVIVTAAACEASTMTRGETVVRALVNMLVGTFGKDDVARRAKARAMGLLADYLFDQAEKKEDEDADGKLEVTTDEIARAFNGEMERLKVPLVASSDGENVEVAGWDVPKDEEDA